MTVVECSGWRRGDGGGAARGEHGGKEGLGERTELATETVIWRPSQNGNVLCHSPLGDSLTGVVWRTLARQVVTTRDIQLKEIFSSFFFFFSTGKNSPCPTEIARDKVLNVITTSPRRSAEGRRDKVADM